MDFYRDSNPAGILSSSSDSINLLDHINDATLFKEDDPNGTPRNYKLSARATNGIVMYCARTSEPIIEY